jgi:hypothetical protein
MHVSADSLQPTSDSRGTPLAYSCCMYPTAYYCTAANEMQSSMTNP